MQRSGKRAVQYDLPGRHPASHHPTSVMRRRPRWCASWCVLDFHAHTDTDADPSGNADRCAHGNNNTNSDNHPDTHANGCSDSNTDRNGLLRLWGFVHVSTNARPVRIVPCSAEREVWFGDTDWGNHRRWRVRSVHTNANTTPRRHWLLRVHTRRGCSRLVYRPTKRCVPVWLPALRNLFMRVSMTLRGLSIGAVFLVGGVAVTPPATRLPTPVSTPVVVSECGPCCAK